MKTCLTKIITIVLSGQPDNNLHFDISNFKTMNYLYTNQNKFKLLVVLTTEHQTQLIFGKILISISSSTHAALLVIIVPTDT